LDQEAAVVGPRSVSTPARSAEEPDLFGGANAEFCPAHSIRSRSHPKSASVGAARA
jgi:hypothetical protein